MAGKIVEKDPTTKVAKQRLSVLEMAETLQSRDISFRFGFFPFGEMTFQSNQVFCILEK